MINKNIYFNKFIFSYIFFFIFLCSNIYAQEENATEEKTIITIENAQSTTYEKDKETKNDVIILKGNVRVSVTKGESKTTVIAQQITYDRKTQMMYATGDVEMIQEGGTSDTTNATATSLMFNTSTLEGVFDDGRIVQSQSNTLNLPSGSTLVVSSQLFGKSQENTITFKKGSLTFCDDENPHWKINASRIWLLPGGEFAFLNALLYVGSVPLLYLPVFYYPKDELIYNPVFGFEERRGYFIQTTSYLYGRKPLPKENTSNGEDDALQGLLNFMRPTTLKKQRLEGLILHNLDEDYKGDTSKYFKIFADWYSNLGFFVGFDGVFRPNDYITNIEASAKLGFSNTVFPSDFARIRFTPYSKTGKKYYNTSNFMGLYIPFRYSANLKFALSKPFSFSLSMPIYSDPYFNDDFNYRSEDMDWISYLLQTNNVAENKTPSEISSFSWNVNSSYSLPIASIIRPYISSTSFSLNSSISFSSTLNNSLSNVDSLNIYSPDRKFYFPSQIIPASISASLSGTIFSYSSDSLNTNYYSGKTPDFPLIMPDEFKTEKEKEAEKLKNEEELNQAENEVKEDDKAKDEEKKAKEAEKFAERALPSIKIETPKVTFIPGFAYNLTYSINPSFNSQLSYSSTGLNNPKDFSWSDVRSSMYSLRLPISLNSNASYGGDFFSLNNTISYTSSLQRHPHLSKDIKKGGYTEQNANSLIEADYKASTQDIVNTNTVNLKPFAYIDMFKNTSISYNSTIKLLQTKFIGTVENPEWQYLGPDVTDYESLTSHSLSFTYAMNETEKFSQSLALSMTLPPQVDEYTGTLSLTFPYTTFSLTSGFRQKSFTDTTWERKLLQQTFSLSLFKNTLTFNESYNYNWNEYHHDSFRLSLSWKGLQAAYTMMYTKGYDFDENKGWVPRNEQEFLPYSFSMSYTLPSNTFYFWKNRIKIGPGLSTSIVADLVRPTNSYFLFTPSLNFEITEFLKFSFSATSRNSVLYRYFQKMLGNEGRIPGETNIFIDLIDSFRFDNESKRKGSGFKLQSLDFTLTHDLHDWDFKTTFKMSPRLVTKDNKKYYDFNPHVTISIVWRPMASMKTKIVDEYGEWKIDQ